MVICLKASRSNRVGSLFLRISRFAILYFAVLFLGAAGVFAQSTTKNDKDLMLRRITLAQAYAGSRDSLIWEISRQTGIVVAYSSRSLPPGEVRMRQGQHTMESCLRAIFNRYNVRYVCHTSGMEGKIVVAADSVRMRHVSGYCRDALTGEILIGAHIVDTLLHIGTATNEYGFYSLAIPTGRAVIRTSFVGYAPTIRTIDLRADTTMSTRLSPRILLEEIDVRVTPEMPEEGDAIGVTTFNKEEIKTMPGLMGEADLGRALQQTPGVKSGSEGFGGMSVRGGSQDQNNVLLDDAPLFNANHALGFFSAFNSDAVSYASLFKSGFSARYGGRMSSVLDIKTLDGNMNKFEGNANIGIMASSLLVQGPVKKGEASYLFSARRTYFDLFSNLIQTSNDNHYSYLFYDFHAKINWQVGAKDRLRLTYFNSTDRLTNDTNTGDTEVTYGDEETRYLSSGDESNTRWGTHLVSLRWNHIFGTKVFSNTTLWFTKYAFNSSQSEESLVRNVSRKAGNEYRNGIGDAGARMDVSIFPGVIVADAVRIGAWYSFKSYEPIVSIYSNEPNDSSRTDYARNSTIIRRHEFHGYVEDQLHLGPVWATAGLHLTLVSRDEDSPYLVGEPRLLAGWKIAEPLTLKVGYSLTTQFVYQMRMLSVATPSDIWLPVPRDGGPQRSSQLSVEARWRITPEVTLEVEAYNKRMRRLVTYKTASLYELLHKMDWGNLGTSGKGYARGLEIFLHSRWRRVNGWLGYSLSKARNTFSEINDGEEFRADNDRLHSVQIFTSVAIRKNVDVSLSWTYGSGAPLTLPTQRYSVPGTNAVYNVEPKRNSLKMQAEHQLNLGANIRFGEEHRGSLISFGIYNVYARQNPMFVYWKADKKANGDPSYTLKKFSLIGFPCPYIKYSINF